MERAPSPHAPAVAAFDLDGTLTDGGSVVAWLRAIAGRRAVRRAVLRHGTALLDGALRSGSAADEAKQDLFVEVLAGRSLADVDDVSADFADEHLRRHARVEVVARLGEHVEHGHAVIVVSASPALYVARMAAALGAHGTAATELAVDDGRLTGRYDGDNCRGEQKLARVTTLLERLGTPRTEGRPLYAYGNSRGDLRLLAAADRPVDVSRLGRLGRLRAFPRLAQVPVAP